MDITPETRKRFPSGSCSAIDFPPPPQRSRIIWIDAKCRNDVDGIINRYKAGTLTESEAAAAIYELAYGNS